MGLKVLVIDPSSSAPRTMEFARSPVRIGRSTANEVLLDDPFVSEWHGALNFDDRSLSFVDLGSTNGTVLDGKRLPRKSTTPLADGARLRIGRLELKVNFMPDSQVPRRTPTPGPTSTVAWAGAGVKAFRAGMAARATKSPSAVGSHSPASSVPPTPIYTPGPSSADVAAHTPRTPSPKLTPVSDPTAAPRGLTPLTTSPDTAGRPGDLPPPVVPNVSVLSTPVPPIAAAPTTNPPNMRLSQLPEFFRLALAGERPSGIIPLPILDEPTRPAPPLPPQPPLIAKVTGLVANTTNPVAPPSWTALPAAQQPSQSAENAQKLTQALGVIDAFCEAFIGLRKGYEEFGAEVGVRIINGTSPLHRARTAREVADYLMAPARDTDQRARDLMTIFADFGVHHVAMMDAITQGVRALLESLDPRDQELNPGRKLFSASKSKNQWRDYVDKFGELLGDDAELHAAVFGEEFAKAYAAVAAGPGQRSASPRGRDSGRARLRDDGDDGE